MYHSLALISPQSNFSLDVLERAFRQRLEGLQIVRSGTRFKVSAEAWEMKLTMNSGPTVLAESAEIAQSHGMGRADRDEIATCDRRLEIHGGADPRMDHCNDYIMALECLGAFTGVFLFDPRGPEWI